MSNRSINLVNFLKSHCNLVPRTSASEPGSIISLHELLSDRCPICLVVFADSEFNIIQVDLDQCHHALDSDYLSRYVLAGFNNCPSCRTKWYEKPEAELVTQTIHADTVRLYRNTIRNLVLLIENVQEVGDNIGARVTLAFNEPQSAIPRPHLGTGGTLPADDDVAVFWEDSEAYRMETGRRDRLRRGWRDNEGDVDDGRTRSWSADRQSAAD